ncbi:MAG: PVC-type heme-binding CxxCH protein, partial [Verrucomicrobiota bacterium]
MPRFVAVEPTNALQTFQMKPGFRLELVASEPNVIDPIALSFDENGRMFVVEMNDYSERRDEKLGRIRVLEDLDGDGRYEKATVFADGLPWPTGVICYDGGIFVAASPDVIYLKDTEGDGKADVRKVVFTGFGVGKDKLNVQALLNGFNWGLDNRIHGATAPSGGIVTNLMVAQQAPLNLNGRDFNFDPRTAELFAENGGGQYGFSYDSKGRKFVCSNSHHIQTMMYDAHYAERNPFYAMPGALVDIAVDGPAAEVYRISPEEPWRVIRTKWRVSGVSPGMIEGGGRSAGYFTGATGITMYRGSALPPEFRDNGFIGDAGGNLVHRKIIYPDGPSVKAARPADEQKSEFLASRDTWFRPVQFANAPDGGLYVIDMYREVIEHPWSLPEQIKKHLDLNSGNDRGRIYRVVPTNYKQPQTPHLGNATTIQLVSTLESPNGWHRDTAARLLYQRKDKAAIPLLQTLVAKSSWPLARLHALYALEGAGRIDVKTLLFSLRDADETVRQHAIKLSEPFLRDATSATSLWTALRSMTGDSSV